MLFVFGIQLETIAQTVPITFRVNMSYQIESEQFDPDEEFVDIAGTFNGWGNELTILSDGDGDEIYDITLAGSTPYTTIEFKFRINGQWDGREEFPGGGPNRTYVVQQDSNEIYVWYNDEKSPTGPPTADFSANTQQLFENGIVNFKNTSSGLVEESEWIFEGGEPAGSSMENPVVLYPQAGTYDVTLIVSGQEGSDTLLLEDYIDVIERSEGEVYWWNNTVFYEIFVRSFFDSDNDGIGDFQGIIEKLDYLNDGDPNTDTDLGITGIWLMPIHDSPTYHGYDAIDYRSINPDYGTMEDFKEFLAEAHARGIKVIIDYVMNHSSTQYEWFQQSAQNNPQFRDFYRWFDTNPGYIGPWGQQVWHPAFGDYYYGLFWSGMPDLNYENPAVKDSMFAIADFWLDDIGVDGFRLDAVKYIFEDGQQLENTEETFQFWHDFNVQVKTSKPEAFSVGEAWASTDVVLQYISDDRLDYCFEFDLAFSIMNSVQNGNAQNAISQMQKVYNVYPHLQYGTFLTNHDLNRVMTEFQADVYKAKVAASIYLMLPGVPYIYYGEEIGMTGAKPDEYIRTPMQWNSGYNAGFSYSDPWIEINDNYDTFNVDDMQNDPESILSLYKKLIKIRNEKEAIRLGGYESVVSSEESVMTFLRHYENESILVMVNLDSLDQSDLTLSIIGNKIVPGLYKAKELMFAEDSLTFSVNSSKEITNLVLGGYETKIFSFRNDKVSNVGNEQSVNNTFNLNQNYPNPFNPSTQINYSLATAGQVSIKVYNVLGELVTELINIYQSAGSYSVGFDAGDISSGVYFYQLQIDGSIVGSKKMMLIR